MTSRSSSRSDPAAAGAAVLLLFLFWLAAVPVDAVQKVQYSAYDWQVLKTAHFDIYYQKGSDELARYAADIAEYSHARISASLRFELTHTIPVFIYNGHNDFEDTTITWEVLTEGIGGFTEVYKNRVVVPFSGSYEEFRHVLTHEITHAFEYNIFYGDFWESLFMRPFMFTAPLWFMEGLAEYESLGEDMLSDMMLRDAVMNEMMTSIPELEDLGNLPGFKYFFIYKGGQSFLNYVANTYGRTKPGELLKAFRVSKDMNTAFQSVLTRNVEEISREWVLALKKKYWADIGHQQLWDRRFTFLTKHFQDGSFQNAKPLWIDDDKRIVYFSDSRLTTEIVMADVAAPELKHAIIGSGLNVNFEELHASDNKMSVSGTKVLAFISKNGRYDRINLWSFPKKRIIRRINPKLDKVFSASWSPDSTHLVFAGIKDGRTDLWVCDANGGSMRRLTDDTFYDVLPFWGSDGWIYFTSNRGRGMWSHHYDIWRLDPVAGNFESVVRSAGLDTMPELSPNGRTLAFVSWRSGAPNIFLMSMSNRAVRQITDVIGGTADPTWSSDSCNLAFVFYNRMGQDIVTMSAEQTGLSNNPLGTEFTGRSNVSGELPSTINDRSAERSTPAKFAMTPDWVNFALAYGGYYGLAGFAELLFTDMLGHHSVGINANYFSGLKEFNFDVEYLFQKYRMNLGAAVFNVKDYYLAWNADTLNTELYYRKRTGGYLTAQYPFDRFSLGEARISWIRQTTSSNSKNLTVNVLSPVVAFTYDNTLWNGASFIKGALLYGEYEYGLPAGKGYWSFQRLILDMRYYLAISRESSFAFRYVFASVWGRDADSQKFTVGGPGFVRGFKEALFTGNSVSFLKLEYRFPFVDAVRFAWPFPIIVRDLAGVFFWDMGAVWDDFDKTRFGHVRRQTIYFDDLKSAVGVGFRMNFLYFKLLLDFATPFTGHSIWPIRMWQGYLSIGYDF